MNQTQGEKIRRTFEGIVVSDTMEKTIVVLVERVAVHPKYRKRLKKTTRFKVHDGENRFKVGDVVTFVECRPLSKEKRWRVLYSEKK